MISAIVLTKNEEKNIKECLEGLQWCDEVLVIDDYSLDKTVQIARKLGAKVIKHSLGNDFSQQRNFALTQTKGEWVFFVDADERVSPALATEIKELTHDNAVARKCAKGFYLKRWDFFMGRWLKHGEVGGVRGLGGVKILRLARRDAGEWIRRVDEKWVVKGKTKTLESPLLHYPHPNLTEFLTSISGRSTLNAAEFYQEGKKIILWEWFKPLAKFIQNYFLKLGILDGVQGFVFAVLMSLHSFLVRGKLYILWARNGVARMDLGKKKKRSESFWKILFLVWTILIFISYLYFLFQRGLSKWSSWRF